MGGDNIIVDGYTLRSRYNRHGTEVIGSPWFWVNRFVGHNFAVCIPTSDGQNIGAQKIVIRAGTQFPSMAYLNNGSEVFYVTTEEVTYVRVSGDKEVSWDRLAKITFKADGKTIASYKYTKTNGIDGTIPEVPTKAGYKGAWESYTLNGNDIVVNAVYTAHGFTETETNISKMEFSEGFLILYLTNNDYPTSEGTIDVKGLMSNLHFYDYLEVDGKKMAEGLREIDGAFFSVWNKFGSFATYLPDHYEPTTSVVLKKGCQIPSNANRLDGSKKVCYVLEEDVTFLKEGDIWVRQSNGESDGTPKYDNEYILSDLYQTGHAVSSELEKGYLLVDKTTDGTVYGYNTSQSFSITFDFSLNLGDKDLAAQGDYTVFNIAMATRGYNSSHGFGWRFYLYRPGNPNKCVQFHCTPSENAEDAGNLEAVEWEGVFEKGVTYRVTLGYKVIDEATGKVESYVSINGEEKTQTFVLGASYMNYANTVDSIVFASNSNVTNGVRISDPGMTETDERHTLTLIDGEKTIVSKKAWKYVLPELNAYEYGKQNEVFVGWVADGKLYPAGYEFELTDEVTFNAVWIGMSMRSGAAVRRVGESGLRFLVDINSKAYTEALNTGLILDAGTLVVPTSYLDGTRPFIHESFPEGYYLDIPTEIWTDQSGETWTYAAALVNISPAQYARSMSARGYLKVQYTTGVGYIYTAYSKDLHARSVFDVAVAAIKDGEDLSAIRSYVNNVADLTIINGFDVAINENSEGKHAVDSCDFVELDEGVYSFTVTMDEKVKAVMLNGTRLIAGYTAEIVIANELYNVSGYKLASDGVTITFTLEGLSDEDETSYYAAIVESYKNSED